MTQLHNPVAYFEIPVHDMARAVEFYANVFGYTFDIDTIDNYEMALFPWQAAHPGITGALVKGDVYKATNNGIILYFHTNDIAYTLQCAIDNGAKVLYPITVNEQYGFAVAEFEDTEGNRIALRQVFNEA
ncbi:hypothetical protein LX64_00875 [Chitinophaga skermanii]|uniref:VOC domain-containing protein n=1 Tax=Chitinophaga skermanii TaxID=331697 RepID=A0A327QWF8_9BACT|nr:VOC family protein [Chitinophaga skermanii]RAJ08228.1 hypothetical protein LX64_00875 [Chitinophaga skermanii]